MLALRAGDRLAAVLAVVYGVGTLILPALAGRGSIADTASQWQAQGVNTVTQAALAWAAWRLLRREPVENQVHP
jgi:threonine/homoserine/homoserine lactone efflux protein